MAPQWQNLLHIPLFGGLTMAWIWALKVYPLRQHSLLMIAFLLTAVWGLLDEAHQATVPGRFGSISDMVLNVSGAVLAIAYVRLRNTPNKSVGGDIDVS
jgi:VanZ family protein